MKNKNIGILVLYLLLIFYFYFLKSSIYVDSDEIVNINIYLYPETLLLKNYPNNHIFTSLFGIIIKYLHSTDVMYLRLISWFSLLGIVFFILKTFKNNLTISLFIIIFTLSNYIFSYSILFRGYYFSSFLFVIIFFLLEKFNLTKNYNYLKIIFLLCSFLIFGIISNVYLVLPIILTICFSENKKIIKSFLVYFIIPTLITQGFLIILVGIFKNVDLFSNVFEINITLFQSIISNFYIIVYSGVETIFFNSYTQQELTFKNLVSNFNEDKSILIIFCLAFIISLSNFIKNKTNTLDYIILFFFIIFFLLNKAPPLRIHIGYIYFFIFYIFNNFEKMFSYKLSESIKTNFLIMVCITSLVSINFLQTNNFPSKSLIIDIKNDLFKNNQVKTDLQKCILTTEYLSESNKHYYFYIYSKNCAVKNDIKIFLKFYRENRIKFYK